jgi:hypothetical protein
MLSFVVNTINAASKRSFFIPINAREYLLHIILTLFSQYINPAETFGDIVIDYS